MNARPYLWHRSQERRRPVPDEEHGFCRSRVLFFGWNKDISRNAKQLIEVRRGENSDIRIAVIRRMIAIVREHETGDFIWESPRLGRQLTLSARPEGQRRARGVPDAGIFFRSRAGENDVNR